MLSHISKYSNNKRVTAAQYITELVCENYAIKNKKDLHYKFWLNKEWSKYYRSQIGFANKLLEKYTDVDIISALKSQYGKNIYSLRAPHLPPIIEQMRVIRENQSTKACKNSTANITRSAASGGLKNISNKNMIDKLKELE